VNKLFATAVLLLAFAVSFAQDQQAGNSSGLKRKGWGVELAFSRDYQSSKNLTYYKISFKGDTISESGTTWTPTTLGEAWGIPKVEGDTDEFRFDLLDGTSTLSSPMYQAYGIKPLEFATAFGGLRGAVQVAGRLTDSQEINVGIGLETKPFSFIPPDVGATNNVRIGIFGMKHSQNGDADKDFFTLNYRAFFGMGFDYKRSYNVDELVQSLADRASKLSPDQLQALSEGDPNDPLVQIYDQLSETERSSSIKWKEHLVSYYSARIDQPTFSIELSAEGAYAPESFVRRRYNSMWGATFQWWPSPEDPDSARLFITYQNGFARGDTENPITGILVGFAFKF